MAVWTWGRGVSPARTRAGGPATFSREPRASVYLLGGCERAVSEDPGGNPRRRPRASPRGAPGTIKIRPGAVRARYPAGDLAAPKARSASPSAPIPPRPGTRDASGGADEAATRAPELFERFHLLWREESLHEDDLAGYERLARSLAAALPAARIATGETEERESDFAGLIDRGVRVIQPDVGRAGGLTICRRLSTLAQQRGVWCLPHCFGTGVNLAASAQWMASAEEAPFMEYPVTRSPLRNDLVLGLPQMVDGMVEVSNAPGLGISLDPATLERYRVA